VAERVAPYKRLRAVRLTDQVPRSPSGKLLRRVLVEAERAEAATTAWSRPSADDQ
jgi:acyl-CoA synthetase (AMP-forming)/AMP-acid ligase II